MPECRIFVSSPGDVALERTLVASVVERLRGVFGHRSNIKVILWEQIPLDAKQSFQPQLPDPTDVELFLLLLWKRLGTALPEDALPEGFQSPVTGTEFEFLTALDAQKKNGKPAILVYRKFNNNLAPDDQVEGFFQTHFQDDKKRLQKAFHSFTDAQEFEGLLEGHLHKWFDKNLPEVSDEELAASKNWFSGNPFQGLKAFRFDQANVYRGRGTEIAEGIEKLKSKAAVKQPFLLVMGMSGSGKSSLVRAGILPALYNPEIVPLVSQFYRAIMRPADVEGDPILGLVSALAAPSANQLVETAKITELVALYHSDQDKFVTYLKGKLSTNPENSVLVLVVDQLEELYTSEAISTEQQQQFAALIGRLSEELGIWVIATLRSDCYHLMGDTPIFLKLKQNGGHLDLQPPDLYSIRQMIKEPAELARLHFEAGSGGQPPLDEVIAEGAASSPESLPLLEFTLSQLYQARTASGMLTFKCYYELGGIEGAIASHAETVFTRLDSEVQSEFQKVFNQLVSSKGESRYSRKWATQQALCFSPNASKLVSAFLEARLLVSELNPEGQDVITLAHESLFRHWPRLDDWLDTIRGLLAIRNQLDEEVERWQQANLDSDMLLNAGKPLEDGKSLLASTLTVNGEVTRYVKRSIKRANRNRHFKIGAFVALIFVTLFALNASYSASQSQNVAEKSLAESQDLIEFLIGDLHGQLQSLGRLDVMQSIGEKAMDYFAELDQTQVNESSLLNRSKALYQIGSVYSEINEFDKATQAFTQSLQFARQLVAQSPDNFDYVFELSQAEYWLGYAYWSSGDLTATEVQFNNYLKAAELLVKLSPNDADAVMELSYAYSNLGTLADSRGEIDKAVRNFLYSIDYCQVVLKLHPDHQDAFASLADSYSWLGKAYESRLNFSRAIGFYKSELMLFEQLAEQDNSYQNRFDLALANIRIAVLDLYMGNVNGAKENLLKQAAEISDLVEHDSANLSWRNTKAVTLAHLGQAYLLNNQKTLALQSFEQSYLVNKNTPQDGETYWTKEYYRRHYWYWRTLIANNMTSEAEQIALAILAADSPETEFWKIRIENYGDGDARQISTDIVSQIIGPEELVAYLEWSVVNQNTDTLKQITPLIPDEFWLYPDMKKLQPKIERLQTSNQGNSI